MKEKMREIEMKRGEKINFQKIFENPQTRQMDELLLFFFLQEFRILPCFQLFS